MISYIYQADWKALRGALVGCLALMRRKSSAGVFTGTDAKAVPSLSTEPTGAVFRTA